MHALRAVLDYRLCGRKSEKARKFEELCVERERLKEGEVFLGVLFCLAFSLCARLCPCAQPVR